jgi:ComF family protein
MSKVDNLLAWLIPRQCVLCGEVSGELAICGACRADLPWLADAGPATASGTGRALAALSYEYPVDRMVTRAKFHGQLHFAWALGELIAAVVEERGGELPDLLVPVPLHRERLARRGYNQALEIGRPVAELLRLKLAPSVCERVKPTAEQTGLSAAERRRNLRGAFRVRSPCTGARVAILDDVITTGSTTAALARAFRAAGAAYVEVWAAARTL